MGEQDEEVVAAQPKPARRRRTLFAVVGLAAVLLIGGAVLLRVMPFGHGGEASARATAAAPARAVLVDVPDVISNLDTGGRRASFVKLHAKIQVGGADAAKRLEADMPRVLDLFQTYLRGMRPDELKGGEGVYRLREALIYRLDGLAAPQTVDDLLFTELLVQ